MHYSVRSRPRETIEKPSPSSSNNNGDDENISDFSDCPSNGTNSANSSTRSRHVQSNPTRRSVLGSFHGKKFRNRSENSERRITCSDIDEKEGSEINRRGSVSLLADSPTLGSSFRTLRRSLKGTGSAVAISATESPLESIWDEASSSDDDYDGEVVEIHQAREVELRRVQQGSRDISIKDMRRSGSADSSVALPPRSDSYNTIPGLSKSEAVRVLSRKPKFKASAELASLHREDTSTGSLWVQPEARRVGIGQGSSSTETENWHKDRMGSLRKLPNLAGELRSRSVLKVSGQRATETQDISHDYSLVAHSNLFYAHNQAEVKAPVGAVHSTGAVSVPKFSREQSEGGRSGAWRTKPSRETEMRTSDCLHIGRNPMPNRADGLRSHPVATAQRAAVPIWIKLAQPLPPLPPSASTSFTKNSQP